MGHDSNCKATGSYGEGCTCGKDVFKEVRFPHIKVKLVGRDGNAFNILGIMRDALKEGGVSKKEIDEFIKDAMSGDYDHLLQTCMKWVKVS